MLSGCQKAAKKPVVPENKPDTQIQQTTDSDKRVMANRFSNLAMGVSGVQKATVVVSATQAGMPENTNAPSTSNQDMPGLTPTEKQMPPSTNPNALQPNPSNVPGSDVSGLSSNSGDIPNAVASKLVVMVGLNLDPKAMQDKTKEKTIKEEVRAKIMADDGRISEVLVTNDPDMIKRLQDVAAGVIQGKPMQSYAQDIEELNKNIRGL
jgi:hypothetical protein